MWPSPPYIASDMGSHITMMLLLSLLLYCGTHLVQWRCNNRTHNYIKYKWGGGGGGGARFAHPRFKYLPSRSYKLGCERERADLGYMKSSKERVKAQSLAALPPLWMGPDAMRDYDFSHKYFRMCIPHHHDWLRITALLYLLAKWHNHNHIYTLCVSLYYTLLINSFII